MWASRRISVAAAPLRLPGKNNEADMETDLKLLQDVFEVKQGKG